MSIPIDRKEKLNLLADNAFHFEILELPYFSAFAQTFELPGVTLGRAIRPTPLVDIPEPGDKLEFDDFSITFLIDEELKNYKEIWKWLMHLGYPKNTKEYRLMVQKQTAYTRKSDIQLNCMTNKFNITDSIVFHSAFPIALSGIVFDSANTDVDHPVATATFAYSDYSFRGISTVTPE